jgi:hypothetical protein
MGIPYLGGIAQYLKELDLPGDFVGSISKLLTVFLKWPIFLDGKLDDLGKFPK